MVRILKYTDDTVFISSERKSLTTILLDILVIFLEKVQLQFSIKKSVLK